MKLKLYGITIVSNVSLDFVIETISDYKLVMSEKNQRPKMASFKLRDFLLISTEAAEIFAKESGDYFVFKHK